jgi:phasin family protein
MFAFPEQFSSIAKANIESQLAVSSALTTKAVEALEQMFDLNINAGKALIEDMSVSTRQLLSAKDPQEIGSLLAAQAQPAAAKAIAYGRHLAGIATSTQAEFTRAAEEQFVENGRKLSALVEDVSKNAPAGSENVIAMVKTAIGNANAGYEQLSKTTKQAAEVLEANINSAVSQFSQAAEKTAGAGRARK